MKMLLTRTYAVDAATIGTLTLDGTFECFTLEDKVRAHKIKRETAIPAGTYTVKVTWSKAFSEKYEKLGRGRTVPLLLDVPNFTGIRIHVGYNVKHTEGCILVGKWSLGSGAALTDSEAVYKALRNKLLAATDKITITIQDIAVPMDGLPGCIPPPVFDGVFGAPSRFGRFSDLYR